MKFVYAFLIVAAMAAIASAQVALWELDPNPTHPNTCYLQDTKEAIPLGTSNGPDCSRYTCRKNEKTNKFTLENARCGSPAAPPGCRLVSSNAQDYPACCPTIKCGEN